MKTNLILVAIIIITLGFCYFFGTKWQNERQLRQGKETILSTKERQFKNDLGQSASEVTVWSLRYKELKQAHEKSENLRSEYEVKLAKMYDEINVYKDQIKRYSKIISLNSLHLNSNDTLLMLVPAQCEKLEPLKTKNVEIEFLYNSDEELTGLRHHYEADINTLVILTPKKKKNGNRHIPNWGFVWGWQDESITTVDDSCATITNHISVLFKK